MNKSRANIGSSIFGMSIRIVVYIVITLLFLRCITWSYGLGHSIFYSSAVDSPPGREIEVNIGQGMDARSTALYLKEKGLINNEFSFTIQSKVFGFKIEPGIYKFDTSQTSRKILEMLNAGTTKDKLGGKNKS